MNFEVTVSDQAAAIIGESRQGAHVSNSTERFFDDPAAENKLGAKVELAFGKMFGLEVDTTQREHGDGGVDFTVEVGGRTLKIDVKGARNPVYLLIKEESIDKCADIVVLALVRGSVTFLGWEHGSIMRLMPKRDFGHGIINHYRHHTELRPMWQLQSLLSQGSA